MLRFITFIMLNQMTCTASFILLAFALFWLGQQNLLCHKGHSGYVVINRQPFLKAMVMEVDHSVAWARRFPFVVTACQSGQAAPFDLHISLQLGAQGYRNKRWAQPPLAIWAWEEKFWFQENYMGNFALKGYGKVELVIFCETTFYKQHDMTI